jgi:maleylacetate reductase
MVAIPTTLSAAEFTAFAGVTDVSRRAKEGYGHPLLAPRAVVLDPAMTLSTPPQLWFSTGMKAVDHAVEQLCNPVRSPPWLKQA